MPSIVEEYFNYSESQPGEAKDDNSESELTLEAGASGVPKLLKAFHCFSGIVHQGR